MRTIKPQKKNRLVSLLASKRRWIQALFAIGLYAGLSMLHLNLWIILGIGVGSGIFFGKVFCRWACPIGFMMELMMGMGGENNKFIQMYQYHKLGCPIAWISGALNRFSLFRINLNKDTCLSCGKCDTSCYMPVLEQKKFSLYKKNLERPGDAFSCSRCLVCVSSCPNGSLSYKLSLPRPLSKQSKL
ncbi:4Fe-4S binding protein [Gracilinema caldarium]|uniref:4Fe-4S binding protein n=1 Tax=Gracilinema caldarium TaxID=215591 RepID=UPI0026EEC711|nr:4Fe-4S binding protein [Gracilinema caldarium]